MTELTILVLGIEINVMMEDIVYVERDMMEYKILFNVIYVIIGKFYIIFIKSFYSYNLY